MLKRIFGLLGLAALAAVVTGGYTSGGGGGGASPAYGLLGVQPSSYHNFTDDDYLRPKRFEPKGGIAIILATSDSTYYSNVLPLIDSLANGTGRFADSTAIKGQVIRLTVCVEPESTSATRIGNNLSTSEVVSLASRRGDVEVASTSAITNYMGWHGLYYPGAVKPRAGTAVGMGADFVDAWFEAAQDSAKSWGIPCFRTHNWRDARYQPGIEKRLLDRGYYQAIGKARNVNSLQSDHDATETFAQDAPNYWCWPASMFSRNGADKFAGSHGIGESVPMFNLGARTWDTSSGGSDVTSANASTADSLSMFFDLCAHASCMGIFVINGQVGDSVSTSSMKIAHFRNMVSHVAHRQAEGLLETLTAEQVAARCRGIREGELLNHQNFRVLGPNTAYSHGAIASRLSGLSPIGPTNHVPMGWSVCSQHYDSSVDTLAAPGEALSTNWRAWDLITDGDSIATIYNTRYGNADSVSYGLADSTKNVLMASWQDTNNSRPLAAVIVTMGCDADVIRITGQAMITSNTSGIAVADSFYFAAKAGQFTERWGDHLMEGPSSYHFMATLLRYANATDTTSTSWLPDSLIHKQRVSPQFGNWFVAQDTTLFAGSETDTTNTTGGVLRRLTALPRSDAWGGSGNDQFGWWREVYMKSTVRLLPTFIKGPQATEIDYGYTIGNPRAIKTPAVSAHEAYTSNLKFISELARWYTFSFEVDIDEKTDYVFFWVSVETAAAAGAAAATPNMVISNISAMPY